MACKKNILSYSEIRIPDKVNTYLKETMDGKDYLELAMSGTTVIRYDSLGISLWRIPFTDLPAESDFVLVETNEKGDCKGGRIIHIARGLSSGNLFNGSIQISSLQRVIILKSIIDKGFILVWHRDTKKQDLAVSPSQAPVIPESAGADVLPECIVVGYVTPATGTVSLSVYVRMLSLMSGGSDGDSSGGAGGSSGGSGSSGTSPGTAASGIYANSYTPLNSNGGGNGSLLIRIDSEDGTENPPIDLAAYIKCFSTIPDNANTSYSITIMADIPVDTEPNDLFSFSTGSPGHAFLSFTKQNGAQTITQNIGFYPDASFKDLTNCAPVKGKFSDNGYHEYNASLKMAVTGTKFQEALNSLSSKASAQYDIDQYNCTDLALQSFNAGRIGTPLTLPLYHIPGSPITKSNTPQGLYFELNSMKVTNTPEAGNITAGSAKHYAGASHGPCK